MKKIPYGRQNIDQNDIDAVVSTLQSDYLTQGPKVREFESKFAEYVGANYSVAVNNATSGLHLSVLALNLSKGDRVITTPITFAASANCVRYAGGEVWFADIDPNTYLLDINSVKKTMIFLSDNKLNSLLERINSYLIKRKSFMCEKEKIFLLSTQKKILVLLKKEVLV